MDKISPVPEDRKCSAHDGKSPPPQPIPAPVMGGERGDRQASGDREWGRELHGAMILRAKEGRESGFSRRSRFCERLLSWILNAAGEDTLLRGGFANTIQTVRKLTGGSCARQEDEWVWRTSLGRAARSCSYRQTQKTTRSVRETLMDSLMHSSTASTWRVQNSNGWSRRQRRVEFLTRLCRFRQVCRFHPLAAQEIGAPCQVGPPSHPGDLVLSGDGE